MQIINDKSCLWINSIKSNSSSIEINKNEESDWLIIGAGYTGLSAARKLGELHPEKKIIIADSQIAGEGASGRNSGYLVDTTLNDGFSSNKKLDEYKKKTDIYKLGIEAVKNFVKQYQVDCDWNEAGKYFASSNLNEEKNLSNFSKILQNLGFDHSLLNQSELRERIGTNFYKIALYTKGGILLNPGKLVRAMVDTLPKNVTLYENSTLIRWKKLRGKNFCYFKNGSIKSKKIIFATNGFFKSLGIKKNYNFPLTLTASMTRPLTDKEFEKIGKPKEWGVLPVKPMGATIRMTKDKRILIRNTAEYRNPFSMNKKELYKRSKIHELGIQKRFPDLTNNIIESSWSGIVCRSGNGSNIFEEIENNVYVAGCYNGSGIGLGTLFGEEIAILSSGFKTKNASIILKRKKPNFLPPQPFLMAGVYSKLIYERLKAKNDN